MAGAFEASQVRVSSDNISFLITSDSSRVLGCLLWHRCCVRLLNLVKCVMMMILVLLPAEHAVAIASRVECRGEVNLRVSVRSDEVFNSESIRTTLRAQVRANRPGSGKPLKSQSFVNISHYVCMRI